MRFGGTSPGPGDGNRVGRFHSSIVVAITTVVSVPAIVTVAPTISVIPVAEVPGRSALADSFVDGCTRPSSESAQNTARAALCIVYVTATRGASAVGRTTIFSQCAVGAHRNAVKPGLVEIFSGLHVEANRYEAAITLRVWHRSPSRSAAEVAFRDFTSQQQDCVAVL
jgi:hypothetical protein